MKIIGHRGARGLAPENTLEAIATGLRHHVDEIEIDVHTTKDGIVILHHDAAVHCSPQDLPIKDHPYAELRAQKEDIPTLDEALTFLNQKVPIVVEIKKDVPVEPVLAVLQKHFSTGLRNENVYFGSFEQPLLLAAKETMPHLQLAVIERWSIRHAMRRARDLETKRIIINRRILSNRRVARMAKAGFQVFSYTANEPHKAAQWEKYGLAGVVTDLPNLFE